MRDQKLILTLEVLPEGSKVSKPIMEEGGFTTYVLTEAYMCICSNKHPKQKHLVPLKELREILEYSTTESDAETLQFTIKNTLEDTCEKRTIVMENIF